MAKTDPRDFQKTAANEVNSDIFDININEGASTADMNNALRGMGGVLAAPCDFGDAADAILIDNIQESTLDAGVTIDGLLIKDGGLPDFTFYTPPPGIMSPYGGDTAPALWLLCDGAAVSRTTYADLFAALGTKYGVGDGSTTFNLPNKTDKTSVGAGGTYAVGDTGGAATVTLTGAQSGTSAHGHDVGDRDSAQAGGTDNTRLANGNTGGTTGTFTIPDAVEADAAEAHENMPPFEADNYIIFAGV